ncbi:hypothetical protein PRJH_0153 [Providencia rustigianii]
MIRILWRRIRDHLPDVGKMVETKKAALGDLLKLKNKLKFTAKFKN